MYLRSSVPDTTFLSIIYILQKISALKDRKIQEIQSFEKSYFLANKALPERQANVEYESMIHEKNFVSKLLQLTSHDARI